MPRLEVDNFGYMKVKLNIIVELKVDVTFWVDAQLLTHGIVESDSENTIMILIIIKACN